MNVLFKQLSYHLLLNESRSRKQSKFLFHVFCFSQFSTMVKFQLRLTAIFQLYQSLRESPWCSLAETKLHQV
eukprot:UN02009